MRNYAYLFSIAVVGALVIFQFILFNKKVLFKEDSIEIRTGILKTINVKCENIVSIQLYKVTRRERYGIYTDFISRIMVEELEMEIGRQKEFNTVKEWLESKCRLNQSETAKQMYEKMKIDDSSSTNEELVCEYICEWKKPKHV
jgi:hypothetical protein